MKLRTRLLIFSSIFLLVLPWFGFHFTARIEQSLLEGQEEAQSMVASAIATVLNGYTGLFDIAENALYVYPVKTLIDIDGYDEDWQALLPRMRVYRDEKDRPVFSLLLGDDPDYLYAYLKISDSHIVYRNPRYVPLDASDHVRLEYLDKNTQRHRLVILAEAQGRASVYEVTKDWRYWKSGNNISAVYAWWRETADGYDLELRLPRDWVEPNRRLSLSVVNVFGENERYVDTIVSTHSNAIDGLNPLMFQSAEISSVIKNLSESDSRICVVDRYRRVRAVIGGQKVQIPLCNNIDRVSEKLVNRALQGQTQVSRLQREGETLIVAAHPVSNEGKIIGAVMVSKNSRQILAMQRDTLMEIALASLGLFVLVFASLLFFSSWLAYRINRLQKEATGLIDASGRFVREVEFSDSHRKDEIGELARSFSRLLDRLNSYTRFLETVPRMLRHEILNPVNTISMSLQSMPGESAPKPLQTAGAAVTQLQLIVSKLTEAASIDEALSQDAMEVIDIAALLAEYVENSQLKHPQANLCYSGRTKGVYIRANDIRMVQLLDKIKDNALDFSRPGSPICFAIDVNHGGYVRITIKNEGETIVEEQLSLLFQGMMSQRTEKTGQPHLGIGLYVAHRISRFHQGKLTIANREDGSGVVVILELPLAERAAAEKTTSERTE
ncbi:MAG TPA: HAMP domain-containing protein [Gammaproteobacteria bacterium]|nr:HAMP domain-containing protein [Gammaproteobacteria bacterium]